LKCEQCGRNFVRSIAEYNRSHVKKGKHLFCGRKCAGKGLRRHKPVWLGKYMYTKHTRPVNSKTSTELTSFRYYVHIIKQRCAKSGKLCEITPEDLKETWGAQKGICPLTGWHMVKPLTWIKRGSSAFNRASVDRIDSSKGYTRDNIRFVALMANHAKNKFSDAELIEFCKAVVAKHS